MSHINKDSKDAFNVSRGAKYLGVSAPTLLKYLPTIPHRRMGKRVVISKQALDKWLLNDDGQKAK
jgi:excisionase family DNA binding protein